MIVVSSISVIIVILCPCQSDAQGSFRILASLMKAVCSQTKEFTSSNNLQLAIKDPKSFSQIEYENCRLVSCKRFGGKCVHIAMEQCKKSSKMGAKREESKNIATRVRYNGYKAYQITPQNKLELQTLLDLQNSGVAFFAEPSGVNRTAVALLSPKKQQEFNKVRSSGIQMKETTTDLQALLDAEIVKSSSVPGVLTWDAYYDINDIYAFVDKMAQDHPDTAKVINYGKSFEGRDLKAIFIRNPNDAGPKLTYLIECNIHAREWITSAVCTYLINDLINEKKSCAAGFLKSWNFYIVPVANPDGFQYSHTTDRLWRRTRSTTYTNETGCVGVDPNRNFDSHWGEEGASDSPCSNSYRGHHAHSEVEVQRLVEFFSGISNSERIGIYLSIHSASQLILWPYGYTSTELIPENAFYDEAGKKMADAFAARYGTKFQYGPVAPTIYPAAGTSVDYFYEFLLTNHSKPTLGLTWELRDTGEYGFELPAEQILPSALESIDAVCSSMTSVQPGKKLSCKEKRLSRRKIN